MPVSVSLRASLLASLLADYSFNKFQLLMPQLFKRYNHYISGHACHHLNSSQDCGLFYTFSVEQGFSKSASELNDTNPAPTLCHEINSLLISALNTQCSLIGAILFPYDCDFNLVFRPLLYTVISCWQVVPNCYKETLPSASKSQIQIESCFYSKQFLQLVEMESQK